MTAMIMELSGTLIITAVIIRTATNTGTIIAMKAAAFILLTPFLKTISSAIAIKNNILAMTICITALDTMTKSTLTTRHIVGIAAFVRIAGTIAVNFPSRLIAAAMLVEAIPAVSIPLPVHGAINHLSAAKGEY